MSETYTVLSRVPETKAPTTRSIWAHEVVTARKPAADGWYEVKTHVRRSDALRSAADLSETERVAVRRDRDGEIVARW